MGMIMKKLMAATTALTLLTATASFAEETGATMPVEIVTQDTMMTSDGGIIVPILTMIFLLMVVTGGHHYYPS